MRALSFLSPFLMAFAACLGVHKKGFGPGISSHMGDWMYPGIITLILIPSGPNQPLRASPYALSPALLAQYVGVTGNPK